MTSTVTTTSLEGVSGRLIRVECETNNSLPGITIVGLGSKSVEESKERIRSAFTGSGLEVPRKRIILNLAPADLKKDGASFDLAMALAILAKSGQIPEKSMNSSSAVGELGLDGTIRSVPGVIGHVVAAYRAGLGRVYIPKVNVDQACLVKGIEIIPVANLKELYLHLLDQSPLSVAKPQKIENDNKFSIDLSDIQKQEHAKRALIIAATGGHNVLMKGPPGTGKTMLAKAFISILPALTEKQTLEATQLHSLSSRDVTIVNSPPFRQPHHTASHVAVLGGGRPLVPGEVSLAHHGVLFLDELPEFNRLSLEGLRQPLEDNEITIARAEEKASFPANFILIATQNPCPCGYADDDDRECTCMPFQRSNYEKKLSGPLLDRFDIVVNVPRIESQSVISPVNNGSLSSEEARKQVEVARLVQHKRQQSLNSDLTNRQLNELANISQEAKDLLAKAGDKLFISPRGLIRCLRVARTIADLENNSSVEVSHVSEALQYRHSPQIN